MVSSSPRLHAYACVAVYGVTIGAHRPGAGFYTGPSLVIIDSFLRIRERLMPQRTKPEEEAELLQNPAAPATAAAMVPPLPFLKL